MKWQTNKLHARDRAIHLIEQPGPGRDGRRRRQQVGQSICNSSTRAAGWRSLSRACRPLARLEGVPEAAREHDLPPPAGARTL